MPNNGSKVYAETVDGRKLGVSTHDVARVLGSTSLDTGTLCTAPNINMWAKFKPYEPSILSLRSPRPLTNANRRADQYGLTIPVHQVYGTNGDESNTAWGYSPVTSWKRLTDFVGDSPESDGYCHTAQPPVSAEVTVNGKQIKFKWKFADGTDGSIAPDALVITNVGTMSECYYGYIIYKHNGTSFVPYRIFAAGPVKNHGTAGVALDEYTITLSEQGIYLATAIISPKKYSPEQSVTSAMTHNFAYVHNAYHTIGVDASYGERLFTRDYTDSRYFTRYNMSVGGNAAVKNAYVSVARNSNFSLSATSTYISSLWDKGDHQLAVSMTFMAYDRYGIGGYCPISDGIPSRTEYDSKFNRTYTYALAQWRDSDTDLVVLALRYKPYSGAFNDASSLTSVDWSMTIRRYLAIFGENGNTLFELDLGRGADMIVRGNASEVRSINADPVTQIRFGNEVDGNKNISGLQLQAKFGDNTFNNICRVSGYNIGINIYAQGDGISFFTLFDTAGALRLPVATDLYLDFTADTLPAQQASLEYLK